jgi:protein TonB
MLAYAANRRVAAQRRSAPNAMLVIIALHVAAIAGLMSARMDLPEKLRRAPIIVDLVPAPKPPPRQEIEPTEQQQPNAITRSVPDVPLPVPGPVLDDAGPPPNFDDLIGPKLDPAPRVDPAPVPAPVRLGPRLATPASELRPPYPRSKLASGEEAVLRLSLTVDERGRVVGVEPIGRADGTFLDAARRHLLAHWRYRPATEDGRPVGSTIAVTLRFQLET